MKHDTREAWLLEATTILRDGLFKRHGHAVPTVKVSVGFPGGGSARKRIGEHWHPNATTDKVGQVFINPTIEDAGRALDVLTHELVHAVVPDAGHKKPFKRIAVAIGLEGKMTATHAGEKLAAKLKKLSDQLGPYPHGAINLGMRKKQTTRLIKVECPCGYTARVTRKWIEALGAPLCPCEYKGPGKYEPMIIHHDEDEESESE